MRIALAIFIALHGLIHLLGPARAFGWVDAGPLRAPISAQAGLLWLLAALLLVASALGVALGKSWWWYPALPGVLLSQVMIMTVWSDARFGTLANLVITVPLLVATLDTRPASFHSRFQHDRSALLARTLIEPPRVTEADLQSLPPLMQAYIRRTGAVGCPRVRNLRVTFKAHMRSSAKSSWMPATATQYEFFNPPARLFHMNASQLGVPFDIYHRYVDNAATFQVRIAGLFPVVEKHGAGLTHDETVTLMNDILVMAPVAVLDLPFTFEAMGEQALRATFRNAGYAVSAVLTFDAAGDLVGFTSADRAHDTEGGAATWSTPISAYRQFDGARIGARGDANWIDPTGEWTYGRFEIKSLAYNVTE